MINKFTSFGIFIFSAVVAALMFGMTASTDAQQAPTVLPPSTPVCTVGQPWTVVELGRGITSLDDLTNPANNNRTRRINALNGVNLSNINLGTNVSTGITAAGNGTLTLGEFVSWDSYANRDQSDPAEQMNEQWLVEVTDGAGNTFSTGLTPDLPDSVVNAEVTGSFNESFSITDGIASIVIRHYHDFPANTPVFFNSIVPAAFCYDFQQEEPLLTCESLTAELIGDDRLYEFTVVPSVSGGIMLDELRYEFDFGDGNTLSTTDTVVTHTYAQVSSYTATVTVYSDDFEQNDSCETTVTIPGGGGEVPEESEVLGASTEKEEELLAETGIGSLLVSVVGVAVVIAGLYTLTTRKES